MAHNKKNKIAKNEKLLDWIKKTLIIAISSAAGAALSIIGTTVLFEDVNWCQVGSAALLAFIVAILIRISELGAKKAINKIRKRKE